MYNDTAPEAMQLNVSLQHIKTDKFSSDKRR